MTVVTTVLAGVVAVVVRGREELTEELLIVVAFIPINKWFDSLLGILLLWLVLKSHLIILDDDNCEMEWIVADEVDWDPSAFKPFKREASD